MSDTVLNLSNTLDYTLHRTAASQESWEQAYGAYLEAYDKVQSNAFKALATSNPVKAAQTILYTIKAHGLLQKVPFGQDQNFSHARILAEDRAALARHVPLKFYKAHQVKVLKASVGRMIFVQLPKKWQAQTHDTLIQNPLTHLLTSAQELARMRQKDARFQHLSPYECMMHEYNPDYSQEELNEDLALISETAQKILQKPQPNSVSNDTFVLKATAAQKMKIFKDIGYSMGLNPDTTRYRSAPASAGLGSPSWVQVANDFSENNMVFFARNGLHEVAHGGHKSNLPAHLQKSPCGAPISTGQDEAIARFFESELFETEEYASFFAAKIVRELNGDPKIWNAENLTAYYKTNVVHANRFKCTDIADLEYKRISIEIEQAIINGNEAPQNFPALWNKKTNETFGLNVGKDSYGYADSPLLYAGLIGNYPGYIKAAYLAPQIAQACAQQVFGLKDQLSEGDLRPANQWLTENFHQYGSTLSLSELYQKATGQAPGRDAFIAGMARKFGF